LLKLLPVYWAVTILTFAAQFWLCGSGRDLFVSVNPVRGWEHLIDGGGLTAASGAYLGISLISLLGADTWLWLGLSTHGAGWNVAPLYAPGATSGLALTAVPQAWTLGLELCFYLLAPLLVRARLRFLLVLGAAALIARWVCRPEIAGTVYSRSLFPLEIVHFLAGMLAFRLMGLIAPLKLSRSAICAIAFTGAVVCACCEIPGNGLPVLAVGYLILITTLPFLFLATRDSLTDARAGALSYPIYISHFLVFGLIYQLARPMMTLPWWESVAFCFACLFVFAVMVDRLIARPVDRLRINFGARASRAITKPAAVLAAA